MSTRVVKKNSRKKAEPGYVTHSGLEDYRKKRQPKVCPITERKPRRTWCVDHDHETGYVRGVISDEANILLGKIENFINKTMAGNTVPVEQILKNIIKYLEEQPNQTLHPQGVSDLVRRFKVRLKKKDQVTILQKADVDCSKLKNVTQRANAYRKVIIGDSK